MTVMAGIERDFVPRPDKPEQLQPAVALLLDSYLNGRHTDGAHIEGPSLPTPDVVIHTVDSNGRLRSIPKRPVDAL